MLATHRLTFRLLTALLGVTNPTESLLLGCFRLCASLFTEPVLQFILLGSFKMQFVEGRGRGKYTANWREIQT